MSLQRVNWHSSCDPELLNAVGGQTQTHTLKVWKNFTGFFHPQDGAAGWCMRDLSLSNQKEVPGKCIICLLFTASGKQNLLQRAKPTVF